MRSRLLRDLAKALHHLPTILFTSITSSRVCGKSYKRLPNVSDNPLSKPLLNSGWLFELRGNPALILIWHIPDPQESLSRAAAFLACS